MPYGSYPQMQPQNNNWWFGNNYSSGNSQMSRSQMQPNMGTPNPSMQTPQPMAPVANPMVQQPQSMNNILQVMGPESAEAFQIGPNSKVVLMDSNRAVFYMKQSDDSGFANTKAYAFQEIPLYPESQPVQQPQQVLDPNVQYVTVDEFNERLKTLEDLVMQNG